jgi:hypothetical protein
MTDPSCLHLIHRRSCENEWPLKSYVILGVCRFRGEDEQVHKGVCVVQRWPEDYFYEFWAAEKIKEYLAQKDDPHSVAYLRAWRILDYALAHLEYWGPVQSSAPSARMVNMDYRRAGAFPLQPVILKPAP